MPSYASRSKLFLQYCCALAMMSLGIFLTFFSFVVGFIYLYLKHHYSYWERRNVPHERPLLFLGNMQGIGTAYHFADINRRIYKRFKGTNTPIVGFYTFMKKNAFVLDLDLIKQIMIKDFSSFSDRGIFHNVRDDPLTGNILFLDGEPWRILRHKLSPVFTTGKIKFMFPTIVAIGEQLVNSCHIRMGERGQVVLDFKDICARYTTDVIGTCAFGINCNSLRDPNAEFRRMGRAVFEQPRHSLPIQALMFAAPDWARKLRMKTFTDDVNVFFMNVLRETVDFREHNNVRRNDFMDMLLELKAKRDAMNDSEANLDDLSNGLTFEQLAAQAMMFFLAGFETSSTTLSFCLYELAQNHIIQTKLRQEIISVLAKYKNEITYEAIREMKYLEQVICETLRRYSVLPHIVRKTTVDYRIPNTNILLERGLSLIIPIDSIHMDPEYFPEPEIFNPERFTAENIASRHAFSYLPFGEGPRNCIGMRFGKMQTEIGLVTLLRHFRFSTTTETQIPIIYSKTSFVVAPADGVYLRVSPYVSDTY